ncbi:MAG: hypothetical protein LBC88_04800, partial [Spirochaetaceae bacterium]|nr:hypothetical protein [Spirochaetaceae bacterium]
AGVFVLALAACLNPIGLPSYGSTQGSTGGGNILPGEGRLIIKNLTRDLVVRTVSFTPLSGQDSAPNLEPGPETSNQRSVTLPAGLWKISLVYGAGYTTAINDVMVTEGSAATVYFYKTTGGRGSLETQWLPPTDADLSGNANPGDVLSEDEGFLHVVNKSSVSLITGVEYNNGASWIQVAIPAPAGMSGNIAAGQASSPDLILPRGSWAIRFRLLGKDIPSVAVSRTIIAGQTVDVEYTDSLLTDRPPSGFGSLRIVNYLSSKNITRVVVRTQVNDYAPEEVELTGPIPQGGGSQVRALRAGDTPGSRRDYIVQCYVAANEYYEEVARVIDETISEVFITEDSSKTTEGGGGGGGSAANGALTVYNRYAGQLPFKIFKIYLYKETGAGVWQDYVPPANAAYPKAPANNALHYNGVSGYEGESYIVKGDGQSFDALSEGAYKLLVVGGSYHWPYYTANPAHTAGGVTINEKRITYDCGNIFIAGGSAKVYNFDPYVNGSNDRDTPTGAVKITFLHAGSASGSGGGGDGGPISRIQFVSAAEAETPVYAGSAAYVFNVVPSNLTVNAPQSSVTPLAHGGLMHDQPSDAGGTIPRRFIVWENNDALMPGQKLELLLPPGVYAVRVLNPQGDGATRNKWFGRDQTWYFDLHIAKEASHTIRLQWVYPAITILDDLVRDTGFATVNNINLTGSKFSNPSLGRSVNLREFVEQWSNDPGRWPQYRLADYIWLYYPDDSHLHPGGGPEPGYINHTVGRHYFSYRYDDGDPVYYSYEPYRINFSNGRLYKNDGTEVSHVDGEHLVTKQGGYYTLLMTLEARTELGYTFRGVTPSNDPPTGPRNVNNQGTGFSYYDLLQNSTNGPGFNNGEGTQLYRIRKWGTKDFQNVYDWTVTDGVISNTGKLSGQDRIKVRIMFKQVP